MHPWVCVVIHFHTTLNQPAIKIHQLLQAVYGEKCMSIQRPTTHFLYFANVFANTPRNTKHSLYLFCILCEFHILLMPRKNKPRNPLTFRMNADPNVKCCKMRKT